jgi:hypothetical protein
MKAVLIECEVYSRVVGYYRPVQMWHAGKKLEFAERKFLKLNSEHGLKKSDRNNDPAVAVNHDIFEK